MKKLLSYKKTIIFVAIAAIAGGYYGYKKFTGTSGETRYVLAAVKKGTIVVSITGSGQVSASSQVDIKPKVSGDVVYVGAANGQEVGAGTLIVQLDARDAQKTVRDAEVNLESAKLSLEKLQKPADNLSLIQSENNLTGAKESKQKAEDDLKKAYEDGFNNVSNAFLDLPTIMTGLHDVLFSSNITLSSGGQWNVDAYANAVKVYDEKAEQYQTDVKNKYQTAYDAYNKTFQNYKTTGRSSDTAAIESIINQTYETTKDLADAVKGATNLIQFYEDRLTERNLKPAAIADTHLATLNTYTSKTNTQLLNLLTTKNTIENDKNTITSAERSIAENTESLAKLKAGADALDIESSQLAVKQKENALLDAKEKLDDYFIRAPFAGTAAKLNVKKSDSISAGAAIATLITKQKLAEISLNEIDVAKIKVGQKVTLTFDAVEGLSIAGEVAEIDSIGTVTQGVVTYAVKISFDTQDDRVKSGMSVSAAIITDVKQNVLTAPNSAVKSQGNNHYVEMFDQPMPTGRQAMPQDQGNQGVASALPPRQQPVEIGLSNDNLTEIISGLKEDDQVVTRTITTAAKTAASQAPSLLGNIGGGNRGGGGGGGVRIPTR